LGLATDDQRRLGLGTDNQRRLGLATDDQRRLGLATDDQRRLGLATDDQRRLGEAPSRSDFRKPSAQSPSHQNHKWRCQLDESDFNPNLFGMFGLLKKEDEWYLTNPEKNSPLIHMPAVC
jgi:hypothetical protein